MKMNPRNQPKMLVLLYPSGAQQIVKPNPEMFNGDYHGLALAIGAPHFPVSPKGEPLVKYEIR